MPNTNTEPMSARGLTLIVDGESLAFAQICDAQYTNFSDGILDPDYEVDSDPVLPLRRLIDVAHLLAGATDDGAGEPAITTHYVRASDNNTFGDTDHPNAGWWPDDQDLKAIDFVKHVVGEGYSLDGGTLSPLVLPALRTKTAAQLILMLAVNEAGANDILVVSQADPRGSLTAGLRDLRILANGSTRRVMAACFTRLPERFGRSDPHKCVLMPVKLKSNLQRLLIRPDENRWPLRCVCKQAAPAYPYANADFEVFDLIHDFGLPFVYSDDFDPIHCDDRGKRDHDEYAEYGCSACMDEGLPDYSSRPELVDNREESSTAFLDRLQHRPSPSPTMPATPKKTTPRPSPRTDRPLIALLDLENIDGVVGNLVGHENLGPETRPDFRRVAEFFRERAGAGDLKVLGFLQDHEDGRNHGFARFLEGACDFHIGLLTPEPERSIVDDAINNALADLEERHGDVILLSHDGDYFEHLESLRDHGIDRERRFIVIGFPEMMNNLYRTADWIETIDLEHDVGAFQNPLPNRRRPTAVDDLDPSDALGDFGLNPPDGPDAA